MGDKEKKHIVTLTKLRKEEQVTQTKMLTKSKWTNQNHAKLTGDPSDMFSTNHSKDDVSMTSSSKKHRDDVIMMSLDERYFGGLKCN